MNQIQNKNFLRGFPPDGRYLLAVSGGRDSVALLHWLKERGYKKLIVCHLNHQLRGRSSDANARFVEKLAAQYDVDLEMRSTNVRALAAKQKISIETAAREARYKFFAQVAKQRRTQTIFLGHHADDLVETFLINLFRGSGATGLGLKFREDASNKHLAPLRNRIRRRIIPYLEKTLDRNIRQSIRRAAVIAAEEESWIEDQLPDTTDSELAVEQLRDLPVALQRREILKWLRARQITNVGFDVVEDVRSLLDHDARVAKVNLPQDRHVRRQAGKIFVE